MIYKDKINQFLRKHFLLDWDGVHGASHWGRVLKNAHMLAEGTTADTEILTLFALLHDSCREDEYADPEHGPRASRLAREMNGMLYRISEEQELILVSAIAGHTHQLFHDELTIQICWDADRLDLTRLGIAPDPNRLGTKRAKMVAKSEIVKNS